MTPRSTQGLFPSADNRREDIMPPSTVHVARSSTMPYRRPSDSRAYPGDGASVYPDRRYSAGHGHHAEALPDRAGACARGRAGAEVLPC